MGTTIPTTLNNVEVYNIIDTIFGKNMHAKRVISLANAAIGLLKEFSIINFLLILS